MPGPDAPGRPRGAACLRAGNLSDIASAQRLRQIRGAMSDTGHILVVDDQKEICEVVQEYLSGEGYRVSVAHDGPGMRRLMGQTPVDLVILDLMLPGEDGLTLARSVSDASNVGIIILKGRGETVSRIIGTET